jgi:hypothetical protein
MSFYAFTARVLIGCHSNVIQFIWTTFIFLYFILFLYNWTNFLALNGYLLLAPSSGLDPYIFFSQLASKRPESFEGNYNPFKASNVKLFKATFCDQITRGSMIWVNFAPTQC